MAEPRRLWSRLTSRPQAPRAPRHVDMGDGWTLAMELLTATFVWGGLGWLADGWLGTGPILMALGFVLGNALGVYIIWIRSEDRFAREHAELLARRSHRARGADRLTSAPPTPVSRDPGAVDPTMVDAAPVDRVPVEPVEPVEPVRQETTPGETRA